MKSVPGQASTRRVTRSVTKAAGGTDAAKGECTQRTQTAVASPSRGIRSSARYRGDKAEKQGTNPRNSTIQSRELARQGLKKSPPPQTRQQSRRVPAGRTTTSSKPRRSQVTRPEQPTPRAAGRKTKSKSFVNKVRCFTDGYIGTNLSRPPQFLAGFRK